MPIFYAKYNQLFMKHFLLVFVGVLFLSGSLFGQFGDPNDIFGGPSEPVAPGTRIHYVHAGKNGDGKSWSTAFKNLQDALDAVSSGDEIWVAAGLYLPTQSFDGSNRPEVEVAGFVLKANNVKIYGGFPATGNPTMIDRNQAIHKTILSGDIEGNDNPETGAIIGTNAFHVVINLATDVLLDGFTISGGNAIDNTICLVESYPVNNEQGGGILNVAHSKLILKNSIVKANQATNGAGIANETGSNSEFVNVLICGNSSIGVGGGMYNNGADPVLTNVTISGNLPGGMYSDYSYTTPSNPQLFNTIISGNYFNDDDYTIGSADYYTRCLIGSYYYHEVGGPVMATETTPNDIFMYWVAPRGLSNHDNYRLKAGCFAVNRGNNNYISNETTDLNGKPRITNGTVDLGALEFYYMTMLDVTLGGLGYDVNELKINLYKSDGTQVRELESGEYIVSVEYPGFIMTYYNEDEKQASTWKDATPINVDRANGADQQIPITITLIPERIIEEIGSITISGILGLADDDIHGLSKIRPITNLNGNVSLSTTSALKSDEYVLVKTIQTTDGHYSFTDLPEGYYRITADIAGYDPGTVDIHVVEGVETVNFIVKIDTKTIISESETLTDVPSFQALHLKVYPNPATDVLHVTGLEGNYTVKIMNILGQFVYSTTGTSPELLLNIGHLSSGMYFLRIESNQKATTHKIIKR